MVVMSQPRCVNGLRPKQTADFVQATFSNAFDWKKIMVLQYEFDEINISGAPIVWE